MTHKKMNKRFKKIIIMTLVNFFEEIFLYTTKIFKKSHLGKKMKKEKVLL